MALLLETVYGDLVIDLDVDGSPELCKNILKLATVRFYTNTLIFSVTPNRFFQAGDPVGDGTGGACIYGLIDAVSSNISGDYHRSSKRFLKSVGRPLSVAECREKGRVVATCQGNTKDTIGSQFLITTAEGPDHSLDGYNTLVTTDDNDTSHANKFLSLGVVAEDANGVLDKINAAYTDSEGRPYADIRIIRALVLHDPFEDVIPGMDELMEKMGVKVEAGGCRRVVDSPSPVRPAEERVAHRISAAEIAIDEEDSEDEEERRRKLKIEQEEAARKEDKSRAVVLEMLGDLPDANIRAPENVLFICKLNSVTVDEDLELIFSRFDENVKVEIIRDQETGASLQYAFAEFTNKQAAVEAYFKMNNALVDDRRIKVDFSQSVAKLWDKYNQKMRMPAVGGLGGRNGGGRGGGRGPHGGRGGLDSPYGNINRNRDRDQLQHSRRHDREQDDFGRSKEFRPRGDVQDERRIDRHRPSDHHHRHRHRREERSSSRDKREGRRRNDDDDDDDDDNRGDRKQRKKERRHRADRQYSSSDTESETRKRDRKEERRRRYRHGDRHSHRRYRDDHRDRSDDEQKHGSTRKKDRHQGQRDSDSEHRLKDGGDHDDLLENDRRHTDRRKSRPHRDEADTKHHKHKKRDRDGDSYSRHREGRHHKKHHRRSRSGS